MNGTATSVLTKPEQIEFRYTRSSFLMHAVKAFSAHESRIDKRQLGL